MELAAFELWLRIYLCITNTNFFCSVLTCGSFDSDLVLCHIGFFDCPRCLEQQLREVPGTRISTGIARTGIDYPLSADKHLEFPLVLLCPWVLVWEEQSVACRIRPLRLQNGAVHRSDCVLTITTSQGFLSRFHVSLSHC